MRPTLAMLAAVLVLSGSAEARVRRPPAQRGTPIIAGETSVRVTKSGNVVAPVMPLPRRDINGRARRRHRLAPG